MVREIAWLGKGALRKGQLEGPDFYFYLLQANYVAPYAKFV